MTTADLIVILLVFMIIAGVVAIHQKSLLSAVIAVGALGFAGNVAFLAMGAPDVAIVKAVVEIIMLVMLIRATVGRDVETTSEVRDTFGIAIAMMLIAAFAVFGVIAATKLPEFGEAGAFAEKNADAPSHTYLEKGLDDTGAGAAVTAVLLDYRGYDTLGEATVLFAAVMGAIVLLRKRARRAAGPSGVAPPGSPSAGEGAES
ncbi:MAG: hydrogen gas-evolving membrane-bound hydrogenase subunit E [Planctomycetota bacterium]|jgi:multisubunit Na+/H+ antiporter MnhB subunit